MERRLVDADPGGHVVQKRIALPGRGQRGRARTLVATNFNGRWFFLYGFQKNERSNIDERELGALQGVVRNLLALDDKQIDVAIHDGTLVEINHGNETQKPHP